MAFVHACVSLAKLKFETLKLGFCTVCILRIQSGVLLTYYGRPNHPPWAQPPTLRTLHLSLMNCRPSRNDEFFFPISQSPSCEVLASAVGALSAHADFGCSVAPENFKSVICSKSLARGLGWFWSLFVTIEVS